jgi:hypothetical protein
MTRHIKNALHVILDLQALSDEDLGALAATIAKLAPTSTLFTNNPGIQTLVADVGTRNATLGGVASAIVQAESELVTMKATRDDARDALEKDLVGLRGLVEAKGASVSDANAVGFAARIGRAPIAPLVAPDTVTVILGKKHGQFTVSAKTSLLHAHYDAQWSPDPVGPATWQGIPGSGKRRKVTGHASGTLVWIRFRALRGNAQSDWCNPVSVTVP